MSTRKTKIPVGRIIMSVAALAAPVGAFAADWNGTHVYNPKWPPHAKFHNAQTICLALTGAGLTLWEAWHPGPMTRGRLATTASYAGIFWATQIPAPFFPGSAVVDPDNPIQPFTKFGIPINQVTGAVLAMPLLYAAYRIDARHAKA